MTFRSAGGHEYRKDQPRGHQRREVGGGLCRDVSRCSRIIFRYVTLNISCPNAQDGCTFQDPADARTRYSRRSPRKSSRCCRSSSRYRAIFPCRRVDAIIAVVEKYPFRRRICGRQSCEESRDLYICDHRQKSLASFPAGGISGAPVKKLTTEMIRHIYKKTDGKVCVDRAWRRIHRGGRV